jgi:hypothetical protein
MTLLDLVSRAGDLPDASLSPPLQALWWLKKGNLALGPEWTKAHAICQTAEGTPAYDLVHALAHWIEGDESNARYWYRQVGGEGRAVTIAAEWDRIARRLTES